MGTLLHFVLSLIVIQGAFGNALTYLIPVLVFSTGIDLDHIPFILRSRQGILRARLGAESRSRLHELYGLLLFSLGFSVLSAFCDIALVKTIALATILHYAVDFLLRKTRPLYPFCDQEVFLRNSPDKLRGENANGYQYKLEHVRRIREVVDRSLLRLPLPRINPSIVSGLSVLTTLAFVLALRRSAALAAVFLALTLSLDWLDGLIAKKHNLSSEEGHIADVMSDRLSEGIMAIPFFVPWFYLFVLNSVMTVLSIIKKRHIVFPLRQAFMVWFLFTSI